MLLIIFDKWDVDKLFKKALSSSCTILLGAALCFNAHGAGGSRSDQPRISQQGEDSSLTRGIGQEMVSGDCRGISLERKTGISFIQLHAALMKDWLNEGQMSDTDQFIRSQYEKEHILERKNLSSREVGSWRN